MHTADKIKNSTILLLVGIQVIFNLCVCFADNDYEYLCIILVSRPISVEQIPIRTTIRLKITNIFNVHYKT